MQTPWGNLDVCDAHVHFFSRSFFQLLGAPSGRSAEDIGAALGWQVPAADPACLADAWVSELDRHGVARACVIASVHGDEASVMAAVERHPGRLLGYFMLNPAAPDALERTRAAVASGRVHAVCLFPAMHCYSVEDPRVRQVLEIAASRPGTAVFVHCGVLTVGVRKKLGLPSPFDMRFSNPIDLHAVALRFPEVNFIVPHFGAGYFREALMLADLCPNVYLDTSTLRGSSVARSTSPAPDACCSAPIHPSSRAAGMRACSRNRCVAWRLSGSAPKTPGSSSVPTSSAFFTPEPPPVR